MKTKRCIFTIIAMFFIAFSCINYSYAASSEPNWHGGCYDTNNPYIDGYAGQCTWYVYGRALELTGYNIGFTGWAGGYWDGVNGSFTRSQTPRENAIVCYSGHVAWVEAVNGDQVTISECNRTNNTSARIYSVDDALNRGQYDGRHTMSSEAVKTWCGQSFYGYIYVGPDPSTYPKITWMTANMGSNSLNEFEVRVWTECSVGMKGVTLKVWRSGANPNVISFNMAYNSSNGYWYSLIKASDITGWVNGTANVCCMTAIATNNKNEKSTERGIYDTPVGGIQDLGTFTARIVPVSNSNLAVKLTGDSNGADIKLATKSSTDKYQLWKFEKSSGYYEIKNVANNKVITSLNGDGETNGNPFIGWDDNDSPHARFLIQKYNDGYRLILGNSGTLKAIDVKDGQIQNGQPIQLYENGNTQYNKAQTFKFEIEEETQSTPKNGLHRLLNRWYYYKNGKIDKTFTGLAQYKNDWFYVKNGQIDWTYTGLCYYNNTWFYIEGGILNWTANTLVEYNKAWFKVKGGMVDWTYTGLSYYKNTWFYIQGGMINWTAETLVQYNNSWFKVKGGMVDWNYTGLFSYKGTLFYIQGGMINWNYSGQVTYNGKKYNVKGGIAS